MSGEYIGIINGKIVLRDKDIKKLKEKAKKILRKNQRCYIQYIDDGITII